MPFFLSATATCALVSSPEEVQLSLDGKTDYPGKHSFPENQIDNAERMVGCSWP